MRRVQLLCLAWAAAFGLTATISAQAPTHGSATSEKSVNLTTVALRVHHMDAMMAFYSEAFGARFREVETFGVTSQFGEMAGLTIKLVPIRDGVDFEGYGTVQLGFDVNDVEKVIALAVRHGGRREGDLLRDEGRVHGAVRDPDGNTIELYASHD